VLQDGTPQGRREGEALCHDDSSSLAEQVCAMASDVEQLEQLRPDACVVCACVRYFKRRPAEDCRGKLNYTICSEGVVAVDGIEDGIEAPLDGVQPRAEQLCELGCCR